MYQLTVGQFKSKFSEVLEKVVQGEQITLTYGKQNKKIAAVIPYKQAIKHKKTTLGLLADKASFAIKSDFTMTDEEFLKS